MKFLMKKGATAAIATAAVLAMTAGSALAGATFTINPGAIPGAVITSPFNANFINGISSELLHQNAANTGFGTAAGQTGFVQFGSFKNSNGNVLPFISGLGIDYGLYLKFNIAATYTGGGTGNGSLGSNYAVTQLDFTVYADPGSPNSGPPNNGYTSANAAAAGGGQEATVTNTTDDIVIGIGSLVSGVAVINALGGASINSIENFAVCNGVGTASSGATIISAPSCNGSFGSAFFAAPVPFYNIAFTEFNNTLTGISRGTGLDGRPTIGITDASGGVTFAGTVPEPGSMVLLGLALAGLGISSRRNKNKDAKAAA